MGVVGFDTHCAPLERGRWTYRRSIDISLLWSEGRNGGLRSLRVIVVGLFESGKLKIPIYRGCPTYRCVYGLRHQVTAHGVCLLL